MTLSELTCAYWGHCVRVCDAPYYVCE